MTHYPLEKNTSGVVFIGNKTSKILSTKNNFIFDSGNNRLGINVSNPQYTLDVSGTGAFTAIRFLDGTIQTTAGGGSGSGSSTSYDWKLSAGSGTTVTITSGTNVSFTGFGNITVTRNGTEIRISGAPGSGSGGGTPGGSDTFIQYNSSGAFAGDSSLVWNYGSKALSVSGTSTINSLNTGTVFQVKNTGATTIFSVSDTSQTSFTLFAQAGQTGNLFEVKDSLDNLVYYVDQYGNVDVNNITGDGGTFNKIILNSGLPSPTTNTLYNISGILHFNGTGVAGGLNNLKQGTGVFNPGTLNNRATTTGLYSLPGVTDRHNIVMTLETRLPYGPILQSVNTSGTGSIIVVWANFATGNVTLGNVTGAYIAWYQ